MDSKTLNCIALLESEQLRVLGPPPEKFDLLSPSLQGIVVDGLWKRRAKEFLGDSFEIAEQGLQFDGIAFVPERQVIDVKFATKVIKGEYENSLNVYLSHSEYMFAKGDRARGIHSENTIYPVYILIEGELTLATIFDFQTASNQEAVKLYSAGKWAHYNGIMSAPWSINVFMLDRELERIMTL